MQTRVPAGTPALASIPASSSRAGWCGTGITFTKWPPPPASTGCSSPPGATTPHLAPQTQYSGGTEFATSNRRNLCGVLVGSCDLVIMADFCQYQIFYTFIKSGKENKVLESFILNHSVFFY